MRLPKECGKVARFQLNPHFGVAGSWKVACVGPPPRHAWTPKQIGAQTASTLPADNLTATTSPAHPGSPRMWRLLFFSGRPARSLGESYETRRVTRDLLLRGLAGRPNSSRRTVPRAQRAGARTAPGSGLSTRPWSLSTETSVLRILALTENRYLRPSSNPVPHGRV